MHVNKRHKTNGHDQRQQEEEQEVQCEQISRKDNPTAPLLPSPTAGVVATPAAFPQSTTSTADVAPAMRSQPVDTTQNTAVLSI